MRLQSIIICNGSSIEEFAEHSAPDIQRNKEIQHRQGVQKKRPHHGQVDTSIAECRDLAKLRAGIMLNQCVSGINTN